MAIIDRYRNPADATGMTIVVYLVWFFLGNIGIHRIITGRVGSGLLMMLLHAFGWLTLWLLGFGFIVWGLVGIWWVIDAFLIPGWLREPY